MANEPLTHGGTVLPETFVPRIPVAGTIKIGNATRVGDKVRPEKLDHFRYAGAQPTKDGLYPDHPDFAEENAKHLKRIPIELISNDTAVNVEINRVMGGRSFITCKGNGVVGWRRMVPGDTKLMPNDKQEFVKLPEGTCGDNCPFHKARKCKTNCILRFRIPGATPLGSVWQFRSGWNSTQDILGSMDQLKTLTGGQLARLPFHLIISEQIRQPLVNGNRQTTRFWSVSIGFLGDELELIEALVKAKKIEEGYASLGIKLDAVEQAILKGQQEGEVMADLLDRDQERAFAVHFLPDGDEGTTVPDLEPIGTTPAAPQAPPPPAAPKAEPKPRAAAKPKEEPKPAAQPQQAPLLPDEEIPAEVLALVFPKAADAWTAFHAANDFDDLVEKAAACMGAFVYAGAEGGSLTEGKRKFTAAQSGNAFRERLLAMLKEMGGDQDLVLAEATTILTRYAESLKLVKPTPAAPAKKAYPLPDAYKAMLAKMNTVVAETAEEPLAAHLQSMRELHNLHGDKVGWKDHTGKRIQRNKDDNDPIFQERKARIINAYKAQNAQATRVVIYKELLDKLWKVYTEDIKAWMAE